MRRQSLGLEFRSKGMQECRSSLKILTFKSVCAQALPDNGQCRRSPLKLFVWSQVKSSHALRLCLHAATWVHACWHHSHSSDSARGYAAFSLMPANAAALPSSSRRIFSPLRRVSDLSFADR